MNRTEIEACLARLRSSSMPPDIRHSEIAVKWNTEDGDYVDMNGSGGNVCNSIRAGLLGPSSTDGPQRAPGWHARLATTDDYACTEWHGPYDTREAAEEALVDMYNVYEEDDTQRKDSP